MSENENEFAFATGTTSVADLVRLLATLCDPQGDAEVEAFNQMIREMFGIDGDAIGNKKVTIQWPGGETHEVHVQSRHYGNGDLAIRLMEGNDPDEPPLAVVSVNLEQYGARPDEGCIWVKDYSENEGIEKALVDAKVLELTGRTAQAGYVTCNEARMLWS